MRALLGFILLFLVCSNAQYWEVTKIYESGCIGDPHGVLRFSESETVCSIDTYANCTQDSTTAGFAAKSECVTSDPLAPENLNPLAIYKVNWNVPDCQGPPSSAVITLPGKCFAVPPAINYYSPCISGNISVYSFVDRAECRSALPPPSAYGATGDCQNKFGGSTTFYCPGDFKGYPASTAPTTTPATTTPATTTPATTSSPSGNGAPVVANTPGRKTSDVTQLNVNGASAVLALLLLVI